MRGFATIVLMLLGATVARAERLPVRAYGEAEGLAGDQVRAIAQDRRGFLWLATNAGVSRFDGHEFVDFGPPDGLPAASVRRVAVAADGRVWVLTRDGLARTTGASAGPAFERVPLGDAGAPEPFDLAADPGGGVVVASARGVLRIPAGGAGEQGPEPIDIGPAPAPARAVDPEAVWAIAFDRDGTLWAARRYGLSRRTRAGAVTVWRFPAGRELGPSWGWWPSLRCDAAGRVWIVSPGEGVWGVRRDAGPRDPILGPVLDRGAGLPSDLTRDVGGGADGALWIATTSPALVRAEPVPGGFRFAAYGRADGLPDDEVDALAVDDLGNLWAGTQAGGAARIAAGGWTTWGADDGLATPEVVSLLEDPGDGLLVETGRLHLSRIGGARAEGWAIARVTRGAEFQWGGRGTILRDHRRRFWVATANGAYVYPPDLRAEDLATRRPLRVLTSRDGLGSDVVFQLYEDRSGGVWIGTVDADRAGLCRVTPDLRSIRCFGAREGLPRGAPGAFAEDDAGDLWVGFYEGGAFRFRDGRFETWPEIAPASWRAVHAMARDRAGRLWVAGFPGVVRVDDPSGAAPRFRRYTATDGLASDGTSSVAADADGRLWIGTDRGVDRLDPRTGANRTFTTADGLASNAVVALLVDRDGMVWAGTTRGVSRLAPRDDPAARPPRIWITSVLAAGRRRDASAAALRFASDENNLEFGFTSPSFRVGETMRFRTRLLGASEAWGAPGIARVASYPGLPPGRYRFEVRAVDGDGTPSPAPATIVFTILPPWWRSTPFLATSALIAIAAAIALYRYRVARLVAVERMRTRIATDLHDDIGASLSQIAVLSQVARRRAERGEPGARGALARITELSGELVDALGDVVWAINPGRDHVGDLVTRMRRFATELVAESGVELDLVLPETGLDEPLDPELRRHSFLVFKEALHNAMRHGRPTRVEASLEADERALRLRVSDDGGGFEDAGDRHGHGLASMRARAASIGGELEVRSSPGTGTVVTFRARRGGRRFLSREIGVRERDST